MNFKYLNILIFTFITGTVLALYAELNRYTADPQTTLSLNEQQQFDNHGVTDGNSWQTYFYRGDHLPSFTFKYPPQSEVHATNQTSLGILGPRVAPNAPNWPAISITFYFEETPGTDFYNPPAGADVAQWVLHDTQDPIKGYKKIGDKRIIAGVPALHLIYNGCTNHCQDYATDEYYFIKETHLYHIQLRHTVNNPDWNVYNKFLDSISFGQ